MLVVVGTHNGNLSIVFMGKILPKFKKEMIFKVFSSQKEKKCKSPDPYISLLSCSQKYKRMVKHLYFISDISPNMPKSS
jgi:hypothetical protein